VAAKDDAILTAALELLARDGYSRMSVDAVARRAGVSKPTVYLRYPSKGELATAALESLRLREAPGRTDDIEADLVAHLEHFRATLDRVNGMAMIGTCLAEQSAHPELLTLLRTRTVLPRRSLLTDILTDGVRTGELRAELDPEAIASALLGTYYADYLAGRTPAAGWAAHTVRTVLLGCTARTPGR
jgi:AcrR family transcriptional regulator